jgi:hypothetical protein
MLKIKDNVDLKELEKYGFVDYNEDIYLDKMGELKISLLFGVPFVNKQTRELNILTSLTKLDEFGEGVKEVVMTENIYDLIKANLVEKVEE